MIKQFALLLFAAGLPLSALAKDLPIPPQDQGLPYTRSAQKVAMEVMKPYIVLHALGRYAYVYGTKVRIDNEDILRGEPMLKNGVLYVPEAFAGILTLKPDFKRPDAPEYLKDRWVYDVDVPSLKLKEGVRRLGQGGRRFVALEDVARQLQLSCHQVGNMLFIGEKVPEPKLSGAMLETVVSQFDTPEKYADPSIATKYIPQLKRQGVWTNLAPATAEEIALLDGPEPEWTFTPTADFNEKGMNKRMFGSAVPEPGVFPRLLFSEADLPAIRKQIADNVIAQKTLAEMEVLLNSSWLDPETDDGKVFSKLLSGDTADLKWNPWKDGRRIPFFPGRFEGYRPVIYNSHVAYNSQCLVSMALYALIRDDEELGRRAATALVNLYKLQEPVLDKYLEFSDTELGANPADANGSNTQWRGMTGVIAHMDLPFALDFGGKFMTSEQKKDMARIIAKATYGRRNNGGDGPRRNWRDINHVTWHMTHFLAVAAIEGMEGFDPEAYASGAELVGDFVEWGINEYGTTYESNGKSGGGIVFQSLCMNVLARRGVNYWAHPHWRNMMKSQVLNTAPNGQTTVSSGTWSGGPIATPMTMMFHSVYPQDPYAPFLLSTDFGKSNTTFSMAGKDIKTFDVAAYRRQLEEKRGRTRLPGPNTPAFTLTLIYDTDWKHTTRADLDEAPLDFVDPNQGILSSYSENSRDAAWMHILVRNNHYLGAGHHHADAGMFHFASGGVNWITESAFRKIYDGKYHNEVLIDGLAEPNGVQGRADWLGCRATKDAALASADLTQAYSKAWANQFIYYDTDDWGARPDQFEWHLSKDPLALKAFKGTQRYKMRPWWPTGIFANWTPLLERDYNPVDYAFRSTGLVRGTHDYGIVIDDLKKDDATHLYQWCAMPGPGVWAARPPKILPENMLLLAQSGSARFHAGASRIRSRKGDPQLLICILGGEGLPASFESGPSKSSKFALNPHAAWLEDDPEAVAVPIRIETMNDGPHWRNSDQVQFFYDRIVGGCHSKKANFRTLLIPHTAGEELPAVTYDPETEVATVAWADQVDTLRFNVNAKGRTLVRVERDGKTILEGE